MENFLKELSSIAKLPFEEIINDCKLVMLGDNFVHVTNYLKILDYSNEQVVLKKRKGLLKIIGANLSILQINKKEILIKGQIDSCEMGENNASKK